MAETQIARYFERLRPPTHALASNTLINRPKIQLGTTNISDWITNNVSTLSGVHFPETRYVINISSFDLSLKGRCNFLVVLFERRARLMPVSLPIDPELASKVELDYYRREADRYYIRLGLRVTYPNLVNRLTTKPSPSRVREYF